jgi:hypothetical protein
MGGGYAMSTDELRDVIWNDLFRAKTTKSIDELARLTARETDEVRVAVSHEWFDVAQDHVSIAYIPAPGG